MDVLGARLQRSSVHSPARRYSTTRPEEAVRSAPWRQAAAQPPRSSTHCSAACSRFEALLLWVLRFAVPIAAALVSVPAAQRPVLPVLRCVWRQACPEALSIANPAAAAPRNSAATLADARARPQHRVIAAVPCTPAFAC